MPTRIPTAQEKDDEAIGHVVREGMIKFALPGAAVSSLLCYGMRRRVTQLKATRLEHFVLGFMTYYAFFTMGLATGMTLYQPVFKKKVLERAPNSELAQVIRAEKEKREK